MALGRLCQAVLLMALNCVFANREGAEGHDMLSLEAMADKELKIVAFSDVHGRVRADASESWTATDLEEPPARKPLPDSHTNQNLLDLMASGIIEKTIEEEKPDLLIYGGDMTTMIGDEQYETIEVTGVRSTEQCDGLQKACICTDYQMGEIATFFKWFSSLGPMPKVVVSGNHDVCLDFSIRQDGREDFWQQLAAHVGTDEAKAMMGQGNTTLTHVTPEQQAFIEAMKTVVYLKNECFIWQPSPGMSIPILGSPLSLSREGVNRGAFQYYPSSSESPEGRRETGIDDLEQAISKCTKHGRPIVAIHGPPDNVNSPFPNLKQAYVFDAIMKAQPELVFAGHFHASTNPNFRYLHNPAIMSMDKNGRPHASKYSEAGAQEGVPLYMTPMKQERPEHREHSGIFVRKPVVCRCWASMSNLKCAQCAVPSDPPDGDVTATQE